MVITLDEEGEVEILVSLLEDIRECQRLMKMRDLPGLQAMLGEMRHQLEDATSNKGEGGWHSTRMIT